MTTVGNTYAQPTYPGRAALLRAIDSDDPGLSVLIIAAALEDEDRDFVETMCLRLSVHTNQEVRGNAILGFGHLARLSGRLSSIALQAVQRGLADRSEYVRGQANAAAGDIKHFLGIEVQAART